MRRECYLNIKEIHRVPFARLRPFRDRSIKLAAASLSYVYEKASEVIADSLFTVRYRAVQRLPLDLDVTTCAGAFCWYKPFSPNLNGLRMHQGCGPCVILDASPQSAKICIVSLLQPGDLQISISLIRRQVLDGRQSQVRTFQLKDALAKDSLPILCSYADKSRSKSKIDPGLRFVNDDNKPADCLLRYQYVQCNVQYEASYGELYVLPQCYKMGRQRLDESSLSRVRAVRDKANEDVTSTCSSDSESTTEESEI